jgi:prepilin-type N-terminal cleavage/methylation domain-containing protein
VAPDNVTPGRTLNRQRGVSLIELLVATAVAGVTLCSMWGWLWSAEAAGSASVDRARAETAAAFAARCVADDLRSATTLLQPPSAYTPGRALSVLHQHPDGVPEVVLIVWDPSRNVLWRKAPGTYLADKVKDFAVSYLDCDGNLLSPEDSQTPGCSSTVARVHVDIVVSAGRSVGAAACDVALGQR